LIKAENKNKKRGKGEGGRGIYRYEIAFFEERRWKSGEMRERRWTEGEVDGGGDGRRGRWTER
jgi:hypothetical protein